GGIFRLWRARERKLFHNLASAGENHAGHAVMRADRAAVVKRLLAAFLHARQILLRIRAQTEFTRNDFFREIAFADEQRHDEDSWSEHAAQHTGDARLKLPKAFEHLRKNLASAQFVRVLMSRRAGFRIQRRAMAHEDKRRIGEIVFHFEKWLA